MNWQEIPRSKAYNECMTYFDSTDDKTRHILLSVNEADQQLVMQGLANKLYGYIVTKVNGIDYGTIPLSKGNIQRIENYDQLIDCIGVLTQILINYKQPIDQIDVINNAIKNVTDRTKLFTEAYKLNIEMPIIAYNTIVLSIVSTVSLLISAHVEFIKMGDDAGYEIAFYKSTKYRSKEKLLFNTLKDFNNLCTSGEFDKTMQYVMKNAVAKKHEQTIVYEGVKVIPVEPFSNGVITFLPIGMMPKNLKKGDIIFSASGKMYNVMGTNSNNVQLLDLNSTQSTINTDSQSINEDLAAAGLMAASYPGQAIGAAVNTGVNSVGTWLSSHPILLGIAGFILGIIVIIKLIRWAIYYFYRERTTYSEKCEVMSSMLYMNAMNYQNNLSVDTNKRKVVAEKQSRLAKFFKKIADILKVNDTKAETQATQEIYQEDKNKLKFSDISNTIPQSAQDSIF